jgi:hypothetical protein
LYKWFDKYAVYFSFAGPNSQFLQSATFDFTLLTKFQAFLASSIKSAERNSLIIIKSNLNNIFSTIFCVALLKSFFWLKVLGKL